MEPVLCKDCKHYVKEKWYDALGYARCGHPVACWLVDGTPYLACGQVWQDDVNKYSGYGPGPCGVEARLFERK